MKEPAKWSVFLFFIKMYIENVPSELYNVKENTISVVYFPFDTELYYYGIGKILENNRLLLTHAYIPNQKEYIEEKAFPYDSMAVINLNNMQIEKIIKKKTNKLIKPYPNPVATLLNNNKISPSKGDKFLFFERNEQPNGDYDNVYEYDISTDTVKQVGKVLKRVYLYSKKINDDKIAVISGYKVGDNYLLRPLKEIELYDVNTNESKVAADLILKRHRNMDAGTNFTTLGDKNKYLFIFSGRKIADVIDLG